MKQKVHWSQNGLIFGQNLGVAKTRTADAEENFGQYCSTFKIKK